jgi:hypothetical protein
MRLLRRGFVPGNDLPGKIHCMLHRQITFSMLISRERL